VNIIGEPDMLKIANKLRIALIGSMATDFVIGFMKG
jgi:hypothetical protein